jgi:hypothetical protein
LESENNIRGPNILIAAALTKRASASEKIRKYCEPNSEAHVYSTDKTISSIEFLIQK